MFIVLFCVVCVWFVLFCYKLVCVSCSVGFVFVWFHLMFVFILLLLVKLCCSLCVFVFIVWCAVFSLCLL